MAGIKIAYIGGGSTRAAGTLASFAHQGENFDGSHISLIDLDTDRLEVVRRLGQRMMDARGLDIEITATTDRRAGLDASDAVLTSFRAGGFEARVIDECVPLTYGVIGQETQGPGGFFMALRSIAAMQPIIDDVRAACPGAVIFNYTNPVNVVSQAVADHTEIRIVSLCEGPIVFPAALVEALGLDPELLDVASVGLNHGSWSVKHDYDGRPLIPVLQDAWENGDLDRFPGLDPQLRRMLQLAATMGSIPSGYFQYYYFERELLRELQAKSTTRGQDILADVPSYWEHYREQAEQPDPELDPRRSRGGIHELELALDCMDSVFNHKDETMTVNVPNRGTLPGFADNLVIETLGTCAAAGIEPLPMPPLPAHTSGLVEALASYQQAAADAAWDGDTRDAVRALASHPLVRSIDVATRMYAEMSHLHRHHLPDRLVA